MGRYSGSSNQVRRVVMRPAIKRAFWSRERVHQGETVTLFIETMLMPDDVELMVSIRELGSNLLVDEPKGPFRVKGNRCAYEYLVDWDETTLGRPLVLNSDRFMFYFLVEHGPFRLSVRSNEMYVDLRAAPG
jgi:hypothetical protein